MLFMIVAPYLRHGIVGSDIARKMVGKLPGEPNFDDLGQVIKANAQPRPPVASSMFRIASPLSL